MPAQFSVRVTVRSYEIDSIGHVNQAVYHQYGEHARSAHLLAAGFTMAAQLQRKLGIVVLESRIRYLSELTLGEEVEVTSDLEFGAGKSFRIRHLLLRSGDDRAAEIECVMGLMDTEARRLVSDPGGRLRALATRPELIGGTAMGRRAAEPRP